MGVVGGDLFAPSLADLILYAVATSCFTVYLFYTRNPGHKLNIWLAKADSFVRLTIALVLFLAQGFYAARNVYYAREAGYILSLGLLLTNVADFLWCCPTGYISSFISGAVSMTFALFAALSFDENQRIAYITMAAIVYTANFVILFLSRHRNDFWAWIVLLSVPVIGVVYLILFILGHAWKHTIDLVGETWGCFGVDLYAYIILQIIIIVHKRAYAMKRDAQSHHHPVPLVSVPPQWAHALSPEFAYAPQVVASAAPPASGSEEYDTM
jgi:hypothetical protein